MRDSGNEIWLHMGHLISEDESVVVPHFPALVAIKWRL